MGIRTWWTRLVGGVRRGRRPAGGPASPGRTVAEQDTDRETRRQAGLSDEDRAWEQASQQRDREQRDRAGAAEPPGDA
jgi:hypothetical protein